MSQGQNNTPLLLFRFVYQDSIWAYFLLIAELHGPNLCHKSGDLGVTYAAVSFLRQALQQPFQPPLLCLFWILLVILIYEFKALCPSGKESICSTVSKTLSSPNEGIDGFSVSAGKQKELAGSAPDTMESATPKTCCRHTKSPIYILH